MGILSKICQVWKRKCKGRMWCVYVCAQKKVGDIKINWFV